MWLISWWAVGRRTLAALDILTLVINLFGIATIAAITAIANSDTVPKATNAPKAIKSTLVLKPLKKDQSNSIFVISRFFGEMVKLAITTSFHQAKKSRHLHLRDGSLIRVILHIIYQKNIHHTHRSCFLSSADETDPFYIRFDFTFSNNRMESQSQTLYTIYEEYHIMRGTMRCKVQDKYRVL